MRFFKRAISVAILAAFLFNTAVSDYAFARDISNGPLQNNLSVSGKTDDLIGVDRLRAFEVEYAMYSFLTDLFPGSAKFNVSTMKTRMDEFPQKGKLANGKVAIKPFFNEMPDSNIGGRYYVMFEVSDTEGKERFYVEFKQKGSGFVVQAFPEGGEAEDRYKSLVNPSPALAKMGYLPTREEAEWLRNNRRSFEEAFRGGMAERYRDIYEDITKAAQDISVENARVHGRGVIPTRTIDVAESDYPDDEMCVTVGTDRGTGQKYRIVTVFTSFFETLYELRLIASTFVDAKRAAAEDVIKANIYGAMYHETGHSAEQNAGEFNIQDLFNDPSLVKYWAKALGIERVGVSSDYEFTNIVADALADSWIGGLGNKDYVKNKAACIFSMAVAQNSGSDYHAIKENGRTFVLINRETGVDPQQIKEFVAAYYMARPHLAALMLKGNKIGEVADKVVEYYNLFYGNASNANSSTAPATEATSPATAFMNRDAGRETASCDLTEIGEKRNEFKIGEIVYYFSEFVKSEAAKRSERIWTSLDELKDSARLSWNDVENGCPVKAYCDKTSDHRIPADDIKSGYGFYDSTCLNIIVSPFNGACSSSYERIGLITDKESGMVRLVHYWNSAKRDGIKNTEEEKEVLYEANVNDADLMEIFPCIVGCVTELLEKINLEDAVKKMVAAANARQEAKEAAAALWKNKVSELLRRDPSLLINIGNPRRERMRKILRGLKPGADKYMSWDAVGYPLRTTTRMGFRLPCGPEDFAKSFSARQLNDTSKPEILILHVSSSDLGYGWEGIKIVEHQDRETIEVRYSYTNEEGPDTVEVLYGANMDEFNMEAARKAIEDKLDAIGLEGVVEKMVASANAKLAAESGLETIPPATAFMNRDEIGAVSDGDGLTDSEERDEVKIDSINIQFGQFMTREKEQRYGRIRQALSRMKEGAQMSWDDTEGGCPMRAVYEDAPNRLIPANVVTLRNFYHQTSTYLSMIRVGNKGNDFYSHEYIALKFDRQNKTARVVHGWNTRCEMRFSEENHKEEVLYEANIYDFDVPDAYQSALRVLEDMKLEEAIEKMVGPANDRQEAKEAAAARWKNRVEKLFSGNQFMLENIARPRASRVKEILKTLTTGADKYMSWDTSGYALKAVTNKGFKLSCSPEVFGRSFSTGELLGKGGRYYILICNSNSRETGNGIELIEIVEHQDRETIEVRYSYTNEEGPDTVEVLYGANMDEFNMEAARKAIEDKLDAIGLEGVVEKMVASANAKLAAESGSEATPPATAFMHRDVRRPAASVDPGVLKYRSMIPTAEEACKQIPDDLKLLVPNELFVDSNEFGNERRHYGNRFELEEVGGAISGVMAYVDNALGKIAEGDEKRTVILLPYSRAEKEAAAWAMTKLSAKGIRFVPIDLGILLRIKDVETNVRSSFREDTFAIMRFVRLVSKDMPKYSPVYIMLKFYIENHFLVPRYGQGPAVSPDDIIAMLIDGRDVARLVNIVLSWRPVLRKDASKAWDRLSHVAIFA